MEWNPIFDDEIRRIIRENPKNYIRVLSSRGVNKHRCKSNTYLFDYIESVTPLLSDPFYAFRTKIFWVLNHLTEFPRCKKCGNPISDWNIVHLDTGYKEYCSRECQYSSDSWRDSVEDGNIKKYGVKNIFMTDSFKSEMSKRKPEISKKKRQTKLERYGNPTWNNPVQAREEKLNRYGSVFNLEKCRETWIKKYGVDNPNKTSDMTLEVRKRRYETMKERGTFNTSKGEESCFAMLCERFPVVERQHKDEKFPFACDFYIPAIDTYVDFNGSWTHGGHPFNPRDNNDMLVVESWRSKGTPYYMNAIYVWTDLDVRKRRIASDSGIRRVELWSLEDTKNWILDDLHRIS